MTYEEYINSDLVKLYKKEGGPSFKIQDKSDASITYGMDQMNKWLKNQKIDSSDTQSEEQNEEVEEENKKEKFSGNRKFAKNIHTYLKKRNKIGGASNDLEVWLDSIQNNSKFRYNIHDYLLKQEKIGGASSNFNEWSNSVFGDTPEDIVEEETEAISEDVIEEGAMPGAYSMTEEGNAIDVLGVPINLDNEEIAVEGEEEEDEATIFENQIKDTNAEIKNLFLKPILNENGTVNRDATLERYDEIRKNFPPGSEYNGAEIIIEGEDIDLDSAFEDIKTFPKWVKPEKEKKWSPSTGKTLVDTKEYTAAKKQAVEDARIERVNQYSDMLTEKYGKAGFKFKRNYTPPADKGIAGKVAGQLSMTIDAPNGEVLTLDSENLDEQQIKDFLKANQIHKTADQVAKEKDAFERWQKGELDIPTTCPEKDKTKCKDVLTLDKIAKPSAGAIAYLRKNAPNMEDIAEDDIGALQEAFSNTLNKATTSDPRMQFITENIQKEIFTKADAKSLEIRGMYDTTTQKGLEKAQDAFKEWYNKEFQAKLKDNKPAKQIFQEYGMAGQHFYANYAKEYGRYNYDTWLDDNVLREIDANIGEGEEQGFFSKMRESFAQLPSSVSATWNKMEVALQEGFEWEKRSKVFKGMKEGFDDGTLNRDMTIGEARELNPAIDEFITWSIHGWSNDDSLGEFYDTRKKRYENTKADMKEDLDEMAEAEMVMGLFNKYDSNSWGDTIANAIQQAPHMAPTMLGSLLIAGGTASAVATGGAAAGGAAVAIGAGKILLGVGSAVMAAQTYGDTFIEGTRRQMEEEYGAGGFTTEEYLEALAQEKYGAQLAPVLTAAAVGLSEYAGGKLGGELIGTGVASIIKSKTGRALLGRTLSNFLGASAGTYAGMKGGALEEYLTEGFQSYLEQVGQNAMNLGEAGDMAGQGLKSAFTKNIDLEQIQMEARMGWNMGHLFGIGGLAGTYHGLSKQSLVEQARELVQNIDIVPGSQTGATLEAFFTAAKNKINADTNLNKKQKRKQIQQLSNIREAALKIPSNVKGNARGELMDLLQKQKDLKAKIKQKDNKTISEADGSMAQLEDTEARMKGIIEQSAKEQLALEQGPTQAQGFLIAENQKETTAEEVSTQEAIDYLDKINDGRQRAGLGAELHTEEKIQEAKEEIAQSRNTQAQETAQVATTPQVTSTENRVNDIYNALNKKGQNFIDLMRKKGYTQEQIYKRLKTMAGQPQFTKMSGKQHKAQTGGFVNANQLTEQYKAEDIINNQKDYSEGEIINAYRHLYGKGGPINTGGSETDTVRTLTEIEEKKKSGQGLSPFERGIQEAQQMMKGERDLEGNYIGKKDTKTEGENEKLLKTIKDPKSSKANVNKAIENLINNNKNLYLAAIGYNPEAGTISAKALVDAIKSRLGPIIKNFKASKGTKWSTYVTESLRRKKAEIYKEAGIGQGTDLRIDDDTTQIADKTPKKDFDEKTDKGLKKRKKATVTTNPVIEESVSATTRNQIKEDARSTISNLANKGKSVNEIVKALEKEATKSTWADIKKSIGTLASKAYSDFINKLFDTGFVKNISVADMKNRFTVGGKSLFGIKETGTTPTTSISPKTGKKGIYNKQIFDVTIPPKQTLKDYFIGFVGKGLSSKQKSKYVKRAESLFQLIAKDIALESLQELKVDKDFMNKLGKMLKDQNSTLTAEQFMDAIDQQLDKRNLEDTSFDKIVNDTSKIDRFIDNVLDPIIDQYKGTFGSLNLAAFAQAFKTGLRAYQKGIKNGLSFAESLQKLINSFSVSFKLNLQQKAAFEKGVFEKIKTENQLIEKTLIEIMQTSGINVIAKYIEGDVTVNSKNRPARQESVLQSVIKGKIPGQLIELLRLGYFGRSYENRNGIKYYETINGWVKEGSKKYKQAVKNGTFIAAKGSLYYGVKDPAYVTMMEAANKNNKKKFEKVQRVTIPFVKDKNGKKIFLKLTLADKKANKAQEKINMQALEDLYTILAKRDKNGKLIIPLNDSALLISQSYQGTTGLIKIAAPFAGVSQRLIGGQIEEHSPPASSIGAAMIWGIANNQSELIMQGIRDNYMQVQLSISANNKLNAANLADTITDGMSILTPNVGILRLAKAGINLNTITDLETGKSFADKAGLPLPKEFKSNPIAVKAQNQLLVDMALKPELTLEKARENLKASELTWNKKTVQVKNNAKNLAPEFLSENQTTSEQKETLENSLDTQVNAQKVNKKKKGISVFDFDDTLAKTKEKVIVYAPAFKPGTGQEVSMKLTPAEFAEQAQDLESKGASFDFSQFEDVKGAKKGPLADLALKRQGKFGSGDIFVLTARPQTSAQGIKTFLDGIGLNIPIENITGLEDGTSQAKADWVLSKTKEGYNDFYFADDSKLNVTAVKQILDQVDVKSKVQQAIADKETNLDKEFNKQIEEATGKEAYKEYSKARAKLEGKAKDKSFFKWLGKQLTITPSAEDFMGLMYDLIGKGKQGNRHAKFILDNLMKPFNKAEQAILSAKVTVANDFAALKKTFPSLRTKMGKNPLMQQIGIGPYTKSNAIRVYMWTKQGMEIPGLSKRDQTALVEAVEADSELNVFADEVILIQKEKTYPPPGNNWTGGDMQSDIIGGLDKGFRKKLMTEFNENVAIIFSEKNMNKLEAIYGTKWVEALQDSLRRMKSGSNRPVYQGGGSRIVNELLDWLNGSVGAIMFLNMRSGLLQLISNVNFINWGDNNIYAASKAFASKEYWPTVMKLMNSDYLVNRRDGLKINVNEAELADAAKKSGMKGAIAYMLDKGFIITRIMDSLAIATGGATFYMNRRDALLKRQNPETGKTYTQKEAEAKAFDDFYAISEESQQSSNPSKISQQQASLAGRVILSFQNVTMQYNRKVKKAIRNLYNRRKNPGMTQRESDLGNLSQVIYYTTIQNIIFHSLQQTLFALLFDDETDDEEKDRAANIANGMVDSLLFGLGFGGAAISTVKNVLMKVMEQHEKKTPKYEEAVWSLFDFSPVLDSKVRKIKTGLKTFSWNMEEIKKRGWSLDNPAYLAVAQFISATTNIPIDRVLRKTMNIRAAMDEETRTWQRVALLLGWDTWSVGLPYWGLQSTIKKEDEEKVKIKADYKNDIRKIKASGYKKVMARALKDYDPKDIIELQSPAGTVVYYAKVGDGQQVKNK